MVPLGLTWKSIFLYPMEETEVFLSEVLKFPYNIPRHPGDIFVYTGGGLRKPSLKGL